MKTMEVFYLECIEAKIAQCEKRAMRLHGRFPCMQIQSDLKRAQIAFLEDRKEELALKMVETMVGKDLNKISQFLNRAFLLEFSLPVHAAGNGDTNTDDVEAVSESSDCYPRDGAGIRKMREPIQAGNPERWDSTRIARLFELPWSDGSLLSDDD